MATPLPDVLRLISGLARDVVRGVLSSQTALAQIANPQNASALTPAIAVGASDAAFNAAISQDWRFGTAIHLLLNACLDLRVAPDDDPQAAVVIPIRWVELVSVALWHAPDPRLYRDAMQRGSRALDEAARLGMAATRADLLHALGTLHLDPFMARRNNADLARAYREWHARAEQGETWDGAEHYQVEQDGFPTPEQAMGEAERYYREAAAARTGRSRGVSLKALAQTLYGRKLLNLDVSLEELRKVATEGLGLLDPERDAAMRAELAQYAQQGAASGGADEPVVVPDAWLDRSIDALVARIGSEKAADAVVHTAQLLLGTDAGRGLQLLFDAAPLFDQEDVRDRRRGYREMLRVAFIRAHGELPDGVTREMPIEEAADACVTQAQRDEWDPVRLAAVLIGLATRSPQGDREAIGLQLIAAARRAAPVVAARLAPALDLLESTLQLNEGVNQVNQGHWDEAAQYYLQALVSRSALGERGDTATVAERIYDVAKHGGAAGAQAIEQLLGAHWESVAAVGGDETTTWLQRAFRVAARAVVTSQGSTTTLWNLVQLAKARRFAAMLAAGSARRLDPARMPDALLERIKETRAAALAASPDAFAPGPLDEAVMLSPYSPDSVRLTGDSDEERLTNLEHQFDVALEDQLVALAAGSAGLLITAEDARGALDPETVLLEYFYADVQGSDGVLLMSVSTQESTTWFGTRVPDSSRADLVIDGKRLTIDPYKVSVSQIRDHIQEDPTAGRVLSDAAADALGNSRDLLLPDGLLAALAEQRQAGRSHLCIVPHGPLHYAPMHLLGPTGETLADAWTVTYLPSLQLLAQGHGGLSVRQHRPHRVKAFGLGFEGSPDPIPQAPEEAHAVAASMHTDAIVEDEATERALRAALREARCVHIATHGFHRPYAPCFQRLQMTPADDNDGSFFAYEVLGLDLRGLELVTLGACETALGRFDLADNPHGLPAMLFLAGARTIVGTLWPVETTAARTFFTTLYEALAAGASKLDAFRQAQLRTRELSPEYRDWGPFYFAGDWR